MSSRSPLPILRPGDFQGLQLDRPGGWVVAFLADWCPFCTTFRTMFERLPTDPGITPAIADLTSEENPLWERFAIEIVPTLVVFREGASVFRRDGTAGVGLSQADIERAWAAALDPHPSRAEPAPTHRRRSA